MIGITSRHTLYGNGSSSLSLQQGRNVLKVSYENRMTMRFPPDGTVCGHTFPEDPTKGYIIAGKI